MNICPICGKDARYVYCSLSCSNRSKTAKNEAKYLKNPKLCKQCGGAVPYQARIYNVFCSHSCSASFNNIRREKKTRKCSTCDKVLKTDTDSCIQCFIDRSIIEFGERTLSEFNSTYARHRYQKIRSHAHRVAKQVLKLEKKCAVCSYDLYVELAHKKAIRSFSPDSKLKEINHPDNLIYLCPNHHWEFDSGILVL